MKLPQMNDKPIMRPAVQTKFGGLNHNLSAGDGEIYEMTNMSSREYPLLANRTQRALVETMTPVTPSLTAANDDLYWVNDDGIYRSLGWIGTVSKGYKEFAVMGDMLIIFPDKKYFSLPSGEVRDLAVGVSYAGVSFQNGTYAGIPAYANTIYSLNAGWGSKFKAGDALTIKPAQGTTMTHPENAKTAIVREIDGDYLRFYENTFTLDSTIRYTAGVDGLPAGTYHFEEGGEFTLTTDLSEGDTLTWNGTSIDAVIGGVSSTITVTTGEDGDLLVFADIPTDYTETGTISIAREVPDMDYICVNENRLWGCKGTTIYASALGDPFNFNVFDGLSSDSWQSAVPGDGYFTACVSFGGYPIFFKENSIFKVQGDKPSNFQWTQSTQFGVKTYCNKSLAVAGGTLFYLSRAGICAYQGGAPRVISGPLGANVKWGADARGGSDGIRYYVSMHPVGDVFQVYVYDTRYGEWYREDQECQGEFAFCRDSMYMLDHNTGKIWRLDGATDYDRGATLEDPVTWQAKFADSVNFYETTDTNSQNKKGPLRILIRATLADETTIAVKIRYDDGTTHTVGTLTGTSSEKKKTYIVPLILRRCDHYQLSLDGTGDAVIYSISIEKYSGSQFQGSPGVSLPTQSY